MKNIITKYKAYSKRKQLVIALAAFVLGLILLPNVLVYALSGFAAYKLIDRKGLRYGATTLMGVVTFSSLMLLAAGPSPTYEVAEFTPRVAVQESEIEDAEEKEVTSEMEAVTEAESVPAAKPAPVEGNDTQAQTKPTAPQSTTSTAAPAPAPQPTATEAPAPAPKPTPQSQPVGGGFYTSSASNAKLYYPEGCSAWKNLSHANLRYFSTLEALLSAYPSRTKSPQC